MKIKIQPVTVIHALAELLLVRYGTFGPVPSYAYELQTSSGTTLTTGTVSLTPAQWNAWGSSVDDVAYQQTCILANLGLVAA